MKCAKQIAEWQARVGSEIPIEWLDALADKREHPNGMESCLLRLLREAARHNGKLLSDAITDEFQVWRVPVHVVTDEDREAALKGGVR
jgi:hypothetical protein